MPYKTIADLPKRVQKLPKGAKEIFRAAFNSAHKQYKEEVRAFKVAWAAVKKVYVKAPNGRWVKK